MPLDLPQLLYHFSACPPAQIPPLKCLEDTSNSFQAGAGTAAAGGIRQGMLWGDHQGAGRQVALHLPPLVWKLPGIDGWRPNLSGNLSGAIRAGQVDVAGDSRML